MLLIFDKWWAVEQDGCDRELERHGALGRKIINGCLLQVLQMDQEKFLNSIPIILNSENPGYSFVKEYAEWVYENREDLSVSHVITFWQLESSTYIQNFYYFGGGMELVTEGLNLTGMLLNGELIDTDKDHFYKFKGKNFWTDSHILSFPITGVKTPGYCLSGILVLISQKNHINLSEDQKSLLEMLLKHASPKDIAHPSVIECERILTDRIKTSLVIDPNNPEEKELYDAIVTAIDTLSGKGSEINLGLKHYSQWEILNWETKPMLSKRFSHNANSNELHQNTHYFIDESSGHYLKSILEIFNVSGNNGSALIMVPISEAQQSFKDKTYFNKIDVSSKNSTILVCIERDFSTFNSILGCVSCYYVTDLPYTIFTSPALIIGITQQITKTIITYSSYLNLKLLYSFTIHFDQFSDTRKRFFTNIADVIARWNNAEECLIFIRQQDGYYQNMMNLDDEYNDYEVVNSLNLPKRLARDSGFIDFIKDLSFTRGSGELSENCHLYFNAGNEGVKSAMVFASYSGSELVKTILIFINKRSQNSFDGTLYNNSFSYYGSLKTSLCGALLYHYNLLLQGLESKNYLLKKLRHEIPGRCDAIKGSINKIIDSIKDDQPLSDANLLNIVHMMDQNNSRISMLSKFFSASEFEDSKFAQEKEEMSFKAFMNSQIEIFRTEGEYKGIDIYFDCRNEDGESVKDILFNVSSFFHLSVTNVVNNAIKYAAPGTCVNIIAYKDRIEVTDIGIQIRESERNKIFNEGYRGIDARIITEEGIGYGLSLTRRVIEAHNGSIEYVCALAGNRNYYLERAVYNYYQSLSSAERNKFVYFDAEPQEYNRVNAILKLLNDPKNHTVDKTYLNNKTDVVKKWVEFQTDNNTPFILYPEMFFEKPIYMVTFIITLN